MRSKVQDLTGRRFGKWLVLSQGDKISGGNTYWLCQCDCGNKSQVQRGSLINGGSTQCTDCGQRRIQYCGHIPKMYIRSIRKRAQRRKMEFGISGSHLSDLYEKQDYQCALSRLPIGFYDIPKPGSKSFRPHTASLDRISSSQGYTKENIQWVHRDINIMKNQFSQEHFVHLCKLVVLHYPVSLEEIGEWMESR